MRIPEYEHYKNLDIDAKEKLCKKIVSEFLSPRFRLVSVRVSNGSLPSLYDSISGMFFKLVFPGRFLLGLSEFEEKTIYRIAKSRNAFPPNIDIEWMRPVSEVEVGAILVSVTPVLSGKYIEISRTEPGIPFGPDSPLYIKYENAENFCAEIGFRLPYEREWEYICRAGSSSLFFWGNGLISKKRLEKHLALDFFPDEFGNFHFGKKLRKSDRSAYNPFGFHGLFAGEWCADYFSYGYDREATGERTVRGGGSIFWPWQDEEWLWCISAGRVPGNYTIENRAAFRAVMDINK